MSEQINKVLASTAQAFSTAEQKQARDNISAQAKISYSYSGSTITAIDGSAVGNPASLTSVEHDYNLSGSGTSAVPLGLADPIKMSAQRSAEDPVSSMSLGNTGLKFEVPSAHTSQVDYNRVKVGYEWPSALDVEHSLGWYAHGEIDGGSLSLSAHDCSYISHNVITGSTNNNPYLGIYGGYGSGSLQTSIVAAAGDQNRPDPYIAFGFSGSSEVVDQSSIQRWNSYSAGLFTGASANNCISGDGTSGSPLGISSRIQLNGDTASAEYSPSGVKMSATPYTSTNYRVAGWNIYSTGNATHHRSCGANCSGIEINWDTNYYVMRLSASGIETKDAWSPSRHCAWYNYDGAQQSAYDGKTSVWNDHELTFENSASGAARTVDIDSIDRWNSYSANQAGWNESGNPLSTGFGGNPATAASQYNVGAGNWAARTVKMSGMPDQTMYGFQSRPAGTATYGVNQAGAFVAIPQSTYFTYLFHETGASVHTFDLEIYPTGLTANARLDFVNLCSAASANVKTDSFHGNTAIINPGESATMWYIATAGIWTDGGNPVPV